MKVKVSEATELQLDRMVAKTEKEPVVFARGAVRYVPGQFSNEEPYSPTTDWAQGGPIIEREGILLRPLRRPGHSLDGKWLAMYDGANTGGMVQWVKRTDFPRHYWQGDTPPLIAACRCYVASKLGDEVEVPEELK